MAQQIKGTTIRRVLIATACSLVVLLLCVEIGGRVVTEKFSEDQLRNAGVAGGVEVTVGNAWWQPSILPAIVGGRVDQIAIRLDQAKLYSLPVAEADYLLNDLQIDLSLRNAKVVASSLGSGSVRVLIDPGQIGALVGVPAQIKDGELLLGSPLESAQLSIQGNDLIIDSPQLRAAGQVTALTVTDPQLLPCTPKVRILRDKVELACTGNSLPGVLRNSIGVGTPKIPVDPQPTQLEPPVTLDRGSVSSTAVPNTAVPNTARTTSGVNDGG
ncbi:MAG: hypothetical protein WD029_06785 [Microthrixaceae bacterium]